MNMYRKTAAASYVLTMLNRSGSNNRCTMGVMITVWEGQGRAGGGGGGGYVEERS